MKRAPAIAIDPPTVSESDQKPAKRLLVGQAGLLACALVIAIQLVRWQVIERAAYLEGFQRNLGYQKEILPERGWILDRDAAFLALNHYDYTIEGAPNQIEEMDTVPVAKQLAQLLNRPVDELVTLLAGDGLYAPIARQVPREVGKAIIDLDLPGIIVRPISIRIYPEGTLAAYTLGFFAADGQGYYGLEGYYDSQLKGKIGVRDTRWYPWTEPVSFTDRRASDWEIPRDGYTLVLTIDRTIQYLVEQELRKAVEEYGAEGGSIVVMDVKSGALLALASYPTYDPNHYSDIDQEKLIDPIIGRQYEPGSTFKVITMAAALDAGAVRPDDLYNDMGYIEVGGRILRNWDERHYGMVDMTDIMVRSLNTGIAHVSTLLQPSRFYQYVGRFGFGRETGVDLQGEATGMVRRQGDPEWHESDLGTNAFGQGLAVTPLQMVVAVGAVANRGLLMQPYVVEELIRDDQVMRANRYTVGQVISEETARIVTEMMVQVVERGATLAKVPGYRIAGKTGTAQMPIVGGYDPTLTIASFIGFAPADDPAFVALVKLDKPAQSPWGSTTAAPTFARVARIMLTHLAVPPQEARAGAN